jgi:transposase
MPTPAFDGPSHPRSGCGGVRSESPSGRGEVRVNAASVSRWRALEREQGEAWARPTGGDRPSERIEAHKDTILAILEAKSDIAIKELRGALCERGVVVGYGTIRRFFAPHAITRKKRPFAPANRIGQTS